MQLYRAEIICSEPVGLGFSCDEPDTQVFSYNGEPLTKSRVQNTINKQGIFCWKCHKRNWRLKDLIPITYRSKAQATRM